jgi:DNA repair protein SbcD/Mre11
LSQGLVRILFLADSHLGFDLPFRPRVERRRRGPDFFANFERALKSALEGRVDLVAHGGDLLFRSKVPARLVEMALEPLKRVADSGCPVFVVPGNHERSKIPYGLLTAHPNLHLFDRPRTYTLARDGFRLALTGWPYARKVRSGFKRLLREAGWPLAGADARLLCLHHCFQGAQVGPKDFTFRHAPDVIRASDLPQGLTALLSGHIHRHQVLTQDLAGRPLACPVFYPGSMERTAFAEKDETKGYLTLDLGTQGPDRGRLVSWRFHELPARPMVLLELDAEGLDREELSAWLKKNLAGLDPEAVIKIRVKGEPGPGALELLSAPRLREAALASQNIEAAFVDRPFGQRKKKT